MAEIERLGFIGLGVMGARMCRNLANKSGKPVLGYDIEAGKAAALADACVSVADSVAEVARGADMIFICVPGEPQVRGVTFSMLASSPL